MDRKTADLLAFAISAVLLVGYHLFLKMRLRRDPLYTVQAVNKATRHAWVSHVMASESRAIVAVQTLRNSTMAATFFASTAVLLMMGSLNLADQVDKLTAIWHSLSATEPLPGSFGLAKLLFLVSDFFLAFFCFALSVRFFNHVGYQIGLPQELQPETNASAHVAAHLNRAGQYYTFGMRAYYFSVPLVFWLFSDTIMVASTVVLIAILFANDRAPQPERAET